MESLKLVINVPSETLQQIESLRELSECLNSGDIEAAKEWTAAAIELLARQIVVGKSAG